LRLQQTWTIIIFIFGRISIQQEPTLHIQNFEIDAISEQEKNDPLKSTHIDILFSSSSNLDDPYFGVIFRPSLLRHKGREKKVFWIAKVRRGRFELDYE